MLLQVARAADFGSNDRVLNARTHLGAVLHAGDTALGYDLYSANLNDDEVEGAMSRGLALPDVVLVRYFWRGLMHRVSLSFCVPSACLLCLCMSMDGIGGGMTPFGLSACAVKPLNKFERLASDPH